jgi:hypothetical protein
MRHSYTYRDYDRYLINKANELGEFGPFMAIPSAPSDAIRDAQSKLGRDQGTELFFTQAATAVTQGTRTIFDLPKPFNINRPLRKIRIDAVITNAIATAGYSKISCDAPWSMLQNVRITGTHAQFGVLTPVNLSGRAIFLRGITRSQQSSGAYAKVITTSNNGLLASALVGNSFGQRLMNYDGSAGDAGSNTLVPFQSPLGIAVTDGAIQTGGPFSVFPNSINLYLRFNIDVAPQFGPWSKLSKLPFSWRPEDWADTLQMHLEFGDGNALGANALANVTQTIAFNVYFVYDILGKDYVPKVSPAVLIQGEQGLALPSAGSNNFRLSALQKKKTLGVMLTTGIKSHQATIGPNVAFDAMDDSAFDVTQAVVDGKPIHNNLSNPAYKEHLQEVYNHTFPQGVFLVDFAGPQNPLAAYPGDTVAGGASFELDTNAPDPNAYLAGGNYLATMLQEWYVGTPKVGQ